MIKLNGKFWTDNDTERPKHIVRWDNSYVAICDTASEATAITKALNTSLKDGAKAAKKKRNSMVPLYVAVEGNCELVAAQQALYDAGVCFFEGKIIYNLSLEEFEAEVKAGKRKA